MEELKSPVRHLNTDDPVRLLRDGDYPFALNTVNESSEGDLNLRSRERSMSLLGALPEHHKLLGSCYTTDNNIIAFTTDAAESFIWMVTPDGVEILLRDSDCLKLSKQNKVSAAYRTRLGCEDTIYFTDGLNSPKVINLSDLDRYRNDDGSYECELFDLIRGYVLPCVARVRVVEGGGSVPYGSYNAAIAYLDEQYNQVDWAWSTKVVVVADSDGGGINKTTNALLGKEAPNRSIEIEFDELDQRYPYYRVVIAAATAGTGDANSYLASPPQSINRKTFVYTGQTEGYTNVSLEEIRRRRADISSAEALTVIDNTLLLANVKGRQYRFCDWQKAASKICTNYVIEEIAEGDYYRGSDKWRPTLIGDEVENYGVVFVLPGGYLSPTYHIPGRPIDTAGCGEGSYGQTQQCVIVEGGPVNGGYDPDCPDEYIATFDIEVRNSSGVLIERISQEVRMRTLTTDTVYCTTDMTLDLRIVNWRDNLGPNCNQFESYVREIRPRGDNKPRAILGHDSTVYTAWTEDMAHLISEDRFQEVLDQYMDEYFQGGTKDPRDLEFAAWLSENNKILPFRWEIYNTAIATEEGKGSMGYYACRNSVYETPAGQECVEDYWGVDYFGNKLEGTPVRHHRTPDRSLEPITVDRPDGIRYVRAIGVEFSNLEYPHPDIIGHFFVKVPKTDANSTVIDKGVMKNLNVEGPGDGILTYNNMFTGSRENNLTVHYVVTPTTQYNRILPSVDYIKLETIRRPGDERQTTARYEVKSPYAGDVDVNLGIFEKYYEDEILPSAFNRAVTDRIYIDPYAALSNVEGFTRQLFNQSFLDFRLLVSTEHDVPSLGGPNNFRLYFMSLKRNIEVGCNLDSLIYTPMQDCVFSGVDDSRPLFSGEGVLTALDIEDLQLGDTPLTRNEILFWSQTDINITGRSLKGFWIESKYDQSLRVQGSNSDTSHFRSGEDLGQYFISKFADRVPGSRRWDVKITPSTTKWIYNPDYLRQNNLIEYFPLALAYDCCSDCLEQFGTRIHYSLQSFQEEQADMFRVFLPNNYSDQDAETGNIVDICTYNKEVIFWTEEAQWKLPYGYTERVGTDGTITIIGDGAFLSRPAQKLVDSQAGSYGAMFKNAYIKTPLGVVSVDVRSGKVILYNGRVEILSDKKNRNYFKNNLLPGIEDLHVGYDERHERVLITKRGSDGERDLSWTLSYSFLSQGWVGWHSYMPDGYLVGKDFTVAVGKEGFWRLNTGSHYCVFFNTKYPHTIEVVFNVGGEKSKVLRSISLITSALRWSASEEDYAVVDDATFDEIIIYTEKQCSGKMEIVPLIGGVDYMIDSVTKKESQIHAVKAERDWRLNDFADLVVDYEIPIFRKDWESIKEEYFTDKIINEDAVDSGKEWFDLQPFRDKYFVVRLTMKDQHFLKLVTHYIKANVSESIR